MGLKPALTNGGYLGALTYGASGTYESTLSAMKRTAELGYKPAEKLLGSHTATLTFDAKSCISYQLCLK